MKDGHRVQRVEGEVQALLSEYLIKKMQFSALTTVLRVESNKELRSAKAFISVLGSEDQREQVMERLEAELYHIQGFLNRNMRMKYVPRIRFILDRGLDHMEHVQEVIETLKTEDDQ